MSPGEDYDGLGLSTRGAEGISLQIANNAGGGILPVGPLFGVGAINPPIGGTLAANPMEQGVLNRAYLTIVSSLKIMLRTGVCQVSD